ncbi:MAG: hypothetical protein JXA94_00715, partial [Parachlamydiales bacterium]|nr:hypothetical protein [Parachlamydiales bacterium]
DLSKLSLEQLFNNLKKLNVILDEGSFLKYANSVETPEDFLNLIAFDKDIEIQDQIYLTVFELWKRLLPERKCLTIFLDELDNHIFLYDIDELENDETLQDLIANLKIILDENVDMGMGSEEAFKTILKYLAHDLENFLFDYIAEQIDIENFSYATEIIDEFYPYISKKIWLDFFKAKIVSFEDVSTCNEMLISIFNKLIKKPCLDLQLAILDFMVKIGDRDLFIGIVKLSLPILRNEKDFKHLLKIVADFYLRLDEEKQEKKINDILLKRSKIEDKNVLTKKDEDLKKFNDLIRS